MFQLTSLGIFHSFFPPFIDKFFLSFSMHRLSIILGCKVSMGTNMGLKQLLDLVEKGKAKTATRENYDALTMALRACLSV